MRKPGTWWLAAILIGVALLAPPRARGEGTSRDTLPPVIVPGGGSDDPRRALPNEVEEVPQERRTAIGWPALLGNSVSVFRRSPAGDEDLGLVWLRGQDPIQNRFFVEDVPLTDAQFQALRAVWIPLEQIERTEVYPSVVPISLLDDGLGGAIRFRLMPPELLTPAKLWASLRGGSFGNVRTAVGAQGWAPTPYQILGEYRTAQNNFPYFDDGGTPFNPDDDAMRVRAFNASESFTVAPLFYFGPSRARFRIWNLSSVQTQQIPGAVGLPARGVYRAKSALVSLDGALRGALGTVTPNLSARWQQETFAPSDVLTSRIPTLADTLGLQGKIFLRGADAPTPLGVWRGEIGAGGGLETYGYTAPGFGDGQHRRSVISVAGAGEYEPVGGVRARAEVLGESAMFSASGPEADAGGPTQFGFWSPRLALEVGKPARKLRAEIGWHYRLPSLQERFGSPAGLAASPDLEKERAFKIDLSGQWGLAVSPEGLWRALVFRGALYASEAQDLIAYVANSQATRRAVNLSAARIVGEEIGALAEFAAGWRFKGGLNLLQAENRSDVPSQLGQPLPFRPEYHLGTELSWRNDDASVGYGVDWLGAMTADLIAQQRLAPSQEHSLWANWRFRAWGEIGFEVRNLFDQVATGASLGTWPVTQPLGLPGFPLPGRRWYLSWRSEW